MDRLSVELLAHIAASLQEWEEEGTVKTTYDLAILSRVNKLFNEIATPLLYLEPRLGSRKSAELWAKTYCSKANPWTAIRGGISLRDLVVPRKITLVPAYRNAEEQRLNESNEDATSVFIFRHNTILTPFFFRNLTHFIAREPLVDPDFVSALFGPTGSNRRTIADLSFDVLPGGQNLVLFLLQAFPYFMWDWDNPTSFLDVLDDSEYAEDAWERYVQDGELPDEEMDRIVDEIDERASFCFSVFDEHNLSPPDSFDFLPDVLYSKTQISTSPFTNLRNLSLTIFSNAAVALIFLTPLFPHLQALRLDGALYTTAHFEDKVTMLRYSITKRGGKINPPFTTEDESQDLATLIKSCSWSPLSEKEMDEYQWKPYRGPNLDLLDLSWCELYEGTD